MNSYFASVEQQANPLLRGRPVGVCEHLGGIIIAPSVEAKRLGIKLGTPVWEAVKIFPQIVLLHTDPDKYRHVTEKFLSIFRDYSDDVEQYSIDEAFVDATEYCAGSYDEALLLGLTIKQRLKLEVGEWVSSSIGIAPNKLIAKIAADLGQGDIDRIYTVHPEDIPTLYDRLELTDVPGIGPRLKRALAKLGIFTLKQLAVYPLSNLLNQFGIWGYSLHSLANFNAPQPPLNLRGGEGELLSEAERPKSFGHAYTVAKPLKTFGEIKKLMFKLSDKVGRRMRQHGAAGNIVHYFHSDKQYSGFSKQRKIRDFINDGKDIFQVAWEIFAPSLRVREDRGELRIKIMGVSISGLRFDRDDQDFLFEHYQRPLFLLRAMDQINDKYGEYTITRALMSRAPADWAKDTVGFGRTRSNPG